MHSREDVDSDEEPEEEGKPLTTEELRAKAARAVSEWTDWLARGADNLHTMCWGGFYCQAALHGRHSFIAIGSKFSGT